MENISKKFLKSYYVSMNLFRKRTSLIENIACMSIMTTINVVFVLLTLLIPGSVFFVFFFLSLSSSIIALFCLKQYYLLYLIATLTICLPINFIDALFYVFPSLITGFLFGLFYDYGISPQLLLISLTITQMAFTYISIPIIEAITEHDFTYDMARIFNVETHQYLNYIKHIFILVTSYIQQLFAFIIIYSQIGRFKEQDKLFKYNNQIEFIFAVLSLGLSLIFIAIFSELIYVFLLLSLIITMKFFVSLLLERKTWIYIVLGFSFVATFFLFAMTYKFVEQPFGLMLIGICILSVLFIYKINKLRLIINDMRQN